MAYQIDFTSANWARRRRKKALLRLLLLAMLGGAAWGVHDVHRTYYESTLNMKLAAYGEVARPVEEMNEKWDSVSKDYAALEKYYRLLWAANPTNVLMPMASAEAPRLRRGFSPRSWTLATGGECRLDYRYALDSGDKAEQTRGLEAEVVHAVTSVVKVAGGKVEVTGIRHENLLNVDALDVTIKFSLPNVMSFPAKEKTLVDCVNEIVAMRKRIHESKFAEKIDVAGVTPSAQRIMMEYLPSQYGKDKETGKPNPDFPDLAKVIDVSDWFKRADKFILRNGISGDESRRKRLKEAWAGVGDAKWPWDRFRDLDNAELVSRTKNLASIADGVKRFKVFLEKRQADNRRKLEPFVDAYDFEDIGNKPLVETDLKDRVAVAAGIAQAFVEKESDANIAVSATLSHVDENFAFRWLRWSLSLGGGAGRDGERARTRSEAAGEQPITLAQLADCVRRALTLGPGYALDKVKVDFDVNGNVAVARLEGLFPTKTAEPVKEEKK